MVSKRIAAITLFVLVAFLNSCSDEGTPEAENGFTLSGQVTEKNAGVSGVTLLVNNESAAVTDGSGSFSVPGLAPGSYVIRPEQQGHHFLPGEISVVMVDANLTGIDFERVATDQILHAGAIWVLFNNPVYSVKENTSEILQLDLESNALWYNNSQGGLIYRNVTGDFEISATVAAVRKSDNTMPVSCDICLGGLMVRNPDAAGGEDYVHLVTGYTPDGLGVEFKSTEDGVSEFDTEPDGNNVHDLRIVRDGQTFSLFARMSTEEDWSLVSSFNRPDLPATLQVGLNIYTAQSGAVADLSLIYSGVTVDEK